MSSSALGAPDAQAEAPLRRALNLRDLVFFYIACIVSLSSLAQVAQFGFASIPLFLLAVVTFLIPSGLMVAELNARMPQEGGLYLWTRTAFGDLHGFVAAWSYWIANIVWLPTVALLVSTSVLYMFGQEALALGDDAVYNATVCLAVLWGITGLNYIGMERAKWVQNVGGAASWATVIVLAIAAAVHVWRFGSAQPVSAAALLPDFGDASLIGYFAVVAFCFGGLELAPIMAGEIETPRRTVPRAILISSICVGLIYVIGTVALIVALPEGEIGVIEGVAQAFFAMDEALGIEGLAFLGAGLVAISTLGLFGAWLTGTARIPFVIGIAHYFPDAFAKVHPVHGSPWVALLLQAGLVTVMLLMAVAGSTVEEAFLVLLDMSIILYFIPFLYMFPAFARIMWSDPPGDGLFRFFARGRIALLSVTGAGFLTTLVSTIVSAVPTKDVANPELFVLKVVGGAALLIGAGLAIFFRERAAQRSSA
ncbi:MAG: APC family permease [Pseudomonadales bacterium]|nr:APC family permease [Pseudomonadales bacterium]